MHLNKILLFSFLTIFTSYGQVVTNLPKNAISSKPSPIVTRNYEFRGIYPDFDTTLVGQYIISIFQDSKGNLWFGTGGEGVVRYDEKSLYYYNELDGFNGKRVLAITEDKNGNMWFGTELGVSKYDGKNFKNYTAKSGLTNSMVGRRSIIADKDNTIWVGTQGGVFKYNPSADSKGGIPFSQFPLLAATLKINGIMEDQTGNLWFATHENGIFRFDGKAIINITEQEGLGSNAAGGMIQDKTGNFWFTMKDGICRYDGKTFTNIPANKGIGGSEVWGIYQEKSGVIWISARGSMTRYDPTVDLANPQAFTVFTEKDGINCCVQSMYQDKSGTMWWGAGSGLFRFDGKRFYQVKQRGPW